MKERIETIKKNEEEVRMKKGKDIIETLFFSENFKSSQATAEAFSEA